VDSRLGKGLQSRMGVRTFGESRGRIKGDTTIQQTTGRKEKRKKRILFGRVTRIMDLGGTQKVRGLCERKRARETRVMMILGELTKKISGGKLGSVGGKKGGLKVSTPRKENLASPRKGGA